LAVVFYISTLFPHYTAGATWKSTKSPGRWARHSIVHRHR